MVEKLLIAAPALATVSQFVTRLVASQPMHADLSGSGRHGPVLDLRKPEALG